MNSMSYVCGFPISFDFNQILMINKGAAKRLEMGVQLMWSGLGGKVQERPERGGILIEIPKEKPHEAMEREFQEETGYLIKRKRWHLFLVKEYVGTKIYFFVSFMSPDEISKIKYTYKGHSRKGEGQIDSHNMVDILFDDENYTFDIPYLINFLMRESRRGFLTKLDPEGLNSDAQKSS